jgi:hypothetical protein
VLTLSFSSALGGFFVQKKPFPRCLFACLDLLFLGRERFHAVIEDLIGFFPLILKE